jgi:hypothetical protein
LTNGSALSRDRNPVLRRGGVICAVRDDRGSVGRIATHIVACAGDSKAAFFDEASCEYGSWRRDESGDAATRPDQAACRGADTPTKVRS